MSEKIKEGEWDDVQKWANVVKVINQEMPSLVSKMEGGFGISEIEITADADLANYMDAYYEQKVAQEENEITD
jgi:hypothetical protein